MDTYSARWTEPSRDRCALVALDAHYEWMLPVCGFFLVQNLALGVEAWTWGANEFHPDVVAACDRLGISIKRLPDTGQYCEGWEARHHALCVTEYRRVFMLDVDTYVVGKLPWLFQPMKAGFRLRLGESWENYSKSSFLRFFGLPEKREGYVNYSVWFGEYDRGNQQCRDVLCKTSDFLGTGPAIYGAAGVVGDQDIRNGVLHSFGSIVEPILEHVNAWQSLQEQLAARNAIVHQHEKALNKDAAVRLIRTLCQDSAERIAAFLF